MYNIGEKVSDVAGKRFAVFRAERGLTNAQALNKILCALPTTSKEIDERDKPKGE